MKPTIKKFAETLHQGKEKPGFDLFEEKMRALDKAINKVDRAKVVEDLQKRFKTDSARVDIEHTPTFAKLFPKQHPLFTREDLTLSQWEEQIQRDLFTNPTPKPVPDKINHPPHYTKHPSGVECIQITEHMNFCLGNALKYIWRADLKGDSIENLEKAKWYIQREIDRREEKYETT